MIPISDDNPARRFPFVTIALILGCVAAYVWERSPGVDMDAAIRILGFTPAALGASASADLNPFLTIFTSMFLHGSILHLAGNMLYLWIFGNNVEDAAGHIRFLLFYLICGVAAALALALVDPQSQLPMVGASGAISGVLAGYVLLFPRARITVLIWLGIILYPFRITALWVVGFWFVMQVLSASASPVDQPGVAWWAHVGGFIAGIVLIPLFKSSDFPLFEDVRRKGPWG
jgi:membrane associated rhomboid family serine protease